MRGNSGSAAAHVDEPDDRSPSRWLLARLDDVRRRLVRAAVALAGGFLIAFSAISYIYDFVMRPLARALPDGDRLIYTQAPEGFVLYLKISALVGAILASPFVLWQVWGLVAPALSRRVRRQAVAFVVSSTLLFVAGAAFAHFIAFPWVWRFLVGFAKGSVRFMPEIAPAFSLYARVVVALGLTFQMPVIVFFLARLGVVTHRTLMRYARHAVLVAFAVSAVLTPPDFVSQVLMVGPMLGLYGLAIATAWLFAPRATGGG